MEKISINGSEERFEILSIMPMSEHILKIEFSGQTPDEYGDIQVFTDGGYQCSNLPGYSTVYRNEGQVVYLSNDGSIYAPPDPDEVIPPDPYVPTEEELLEAARSSKKSEMSAACEQTIYSGVSVTLQNGSVEHFSLTEHDQINLFGKQAQLAAGADQLEYHADGQPCRYYSAADMQAIINASMFHVSYHTTYCNALNMWIAGCRTAEEVREISYGVEVPEEYRSEVLQSYIAQMNGLEEDASETSAAE